MSATKKIRLEQKAMPVSSEEELSLITLREQNQKLSNNYNHRIRIETDLRKKIEQLEGTLRLCEDKEPEHQLSIVNEDLRNRVDDLEFELNKVRLNERRLADDLDRINREFTELRKKSLHSSNADSIRNSTSVNYHNDQHNHHHHHHQGTLLNSSGTPGSGSGSDSCNSIGGGGGGGGVGSGGINSGGAPTTCLDDNIMSQQAKAIQDLEIKLNDQVELANNRLKELEALNEQHNEALLAIDKLKTEASCIPKEVIIETAEYKTLQSHFSVLYNEATQLKTQLLESRQLIMEMKNAHARQIDRMEHDELRIQKELRTNIVDLEQSLTDARNQLAMFRLEYDNVLKANEQTVKLDTELKKSVSSYKIQVQQKNNDLNRLKRLLEESKRAERHQNENKSSNHATNNGDNLNNNVSNHSTTNALNNQNKPTTNSTSNNTSNNSSSSSTINSVNNHSPSIKKIQELKEVIHQLQKQLDKTKSEEEALMQDLDVTGQAYEDMQEQNHRLLQQLEEKDDANFKLMSEHLKTNAFQKHLNEEKAQMEEYRDGLLKRISAQDSVVKGLEEKVHLLQENMSTLEKELELRNTLNDSYKQEKLELKQQLAELKSEKDKVLSHLEEIQRSISERTTTLTHESFKNKRLIEELESLKKKYERASKLQSATTPDEVLMEEIREYKEQLTCPSCKTKPKDAVLTKCFHVFCFDCLKTRVDTRQRKCPKCNAQFGANDFHRLYLA